MAKNDWDDPFAEANKTVDIIETRAPVAPAAPVAPTAPVAPAAQQTAPVAEATPAAVVDSSLEALVKEEAGPATTSETEEKAGATGLEQIEMGAARIQVDDKKIINCKADLKLTT